MKTVQEFLAEGTSKIHKEFEKMVTDDYQKREPSGRGPKSNVADSIEVYRNNRDGTIVISALFKNTNEKSAIKWLTNHIKSTLSKFKVNDKDVKYDSWQDGDYADDWVQASADIKDIK